MLRHAFTPALFLPFALAFDCTPSAFKQHLPENAQVSFARSVPEGETFDVPAGDIAYPTSPANLTALCALEVKVTLSSSSAYSFGLFLPDDWNNRFLAVGNGGFAGGINWLDMAAGVGYGFASVSTSTGHNSTSGDGRWAYQNEEARELWGFRALHGSVKIAKEVVSAYYGSKAEYNYYSGCSTGGRQGLKEVQMFPDDFDGVLAGAPAWWTSHLQTWTIKVAQNNLPTTADYHIPPSLFPAIGAEVTRQCDPQDGLVDGIITDPAGCNFFPEALLCGPSVTKQTAAGCLTPAQIGTLYKIYGAYVDTNQTFVFPGLALGSEAQWRAVLLGSSQPASLGYEYPQYFLDLGPQWNWTEFDYSIVQLADAKDPGDANADDFAQMTAFEQRGGKLLTYHGWADAFIPTGSAEVFYKSALKALKPQGVDVDAFYRHFFVPGMQHCSGTPDDVNAPWYFAGGGQAGSIGSSDAPGALHSVPGFEDAEHDVLLALMAWVEKGRAPERVVATKWLNDTEVESGGGEVLRQRPLCMFPKTARFDGDGNPDVPGSWRCEEPWADGMRSQ